MVSNFPSEINKRVSAVRKANFLTQAQLAKAIGLKTSTYSQAEREGKMPAEILIKVADVLNVDVRYLLYGESYLEDEKSDSDEFTVKNPMKYHNVFDLLSFEEANMIKTYRNLKPKERKDAYCYFMDNFNLTTVRKRREQKRLEQKQANEYGNSETGL